MAKQQEAKIFGKNINGNILFFGGKNRSLSSYLSVLTEISNQGYLIIYFPYAFAYNYEKYLEDIERNYRYELGEVSIITHLQGDQEFNYFSYHCKRKIKNCIFISPTTMFVGRFRRYPMLVLWGDKDKKYHSARYAFRLYRLFGHHKNVSFIGYPNTSSFIFGGVSYSQYHDQYDMKKKDDMILDKEKYYHLDSEVMEDIYQYLKTSTTKEKIAIFSDNYLPFINGVNILSNVLKQELESMGKKAYIVTTELKGVNYIKEDQEKNVVTIHSHRLLDKASRKEGVQVILLWHQKANRLRAYGFDYIHLQTEYTISKLAFIICKLDKVPLFFTAHTMWNDMFAKRYRKIWVPFIIFFTNLLMIKVPTKKAQVMSAPTDKVKEFYRTKYKRTKNIVSLPGCVNENNFILKDGDMEIIQKLRTKLKLDGKKVMGYVGRVSREKDIHVVLKYFTKIAKEQPDLVFLIVGSGVHVDELRKQARKHHLSNRVILTGEVKNTELKYYYRLIDVFCTASTFETQGLTYIEAMWCGVPVLAKYDHCLDHFMVPDKNGIVFNDFNDWKKGLLTLLYNEKEIKIIKEGAFKTAKQYEKGTWAKKLLFLYNEAKLIKNKSKKEIDMDAFKSIE